MNGTTLLLLYFGTLFIFCIRQHKVAAFLLAIQLMSLGGTFFMGGDYAMNSLPRVAAFLTIAVVLSFVILPWAGGFRITRLDPGDERKLDRVAKILICLSVLPFFVLSITSFFILTQVQDINDFKYTEDVATDFYYNLPINVRLIILSNYLYNLSYLLLPLHFYYLWRRRFWLSGLCLLLSMNIILYGMTFFSRWSLLHYVFIYSILLLLLRDTLDRAAKRVIKRVAAVLVVAVATYFIILTERRFRNDTAYSDLVPIDSRIQSPVLYSYVSYLSQSTEHGVNKLLDYRFQTFGGQISLNPVLSLLGKYGIIDYNPTAYAELRRTLWPEHADKFSGLACYSVYDYGYIVTSILLLMYVFVIRINRPVKGVISVKGLFHYGLLIQIPMFSIFYSMVAGILIPYLMMIPILLYLNGGRNAILPRRLGSSPSRHSSSLPPGTVGRNGPPKGPYKVLPMARSSE